MRKPACALILAMAAISCSSAARAADAKTCDAYVKEATAKAQGVRQFNCGFDGNDPRWSSERGAHAAWCESADKDAVERETTRRRGELKLCETCRTYAGLALAAAADNVKLKCGFEGPRWGDNAEDHFGWCMAQRGQVDADEKDIAAAYKANLQKTLKPVGLETGERATQILLCQPRRPNAKKPSIR
jgi:hypothetical protein